MNTEFWRIQVVLLVFQDVKCILPSFLEEDFTRKGIQGRRFFFQPPEDLTPWASGTFHPC